MPVSLRKNHKKTYAKKTSKPRLTLGRMIYVIIAATVILAFLLANFYKPARKKSPNPNISHSVKTTPAFKEDGTVKIFSDRFDDPLTVNVEIADNEAKRMQGLMYRHDLPGNAGMFFIFPREESRSFWMKNTFISLDIIYINAAKEIVSIQKYTQPRSTYSLPSEKPAKYVLEVNAGFTDHYGIKPGDRIEFSFRPPL